MRAGLLYLVGNHAGNIRGNWSGLLAYGSTIGLVVLASKKKPSGPRMIKVPKGQKIRAGARTVKMRTRPQVKAVKVSGQVKCDICLGVIKKDLPSVLCGCGKRFHNSCAMRVGKCPICGKELGYTTQRPHVVDSVMPIIKPVPLTKDDKLLLLEERFLLGEVSERTYLSIKEQVENAPETSTFCSVCGRRLLEGESCDCTMFKRELQCPECGETLSEEDQFCRKCGVIFSTEFKKPLFQCPECGTVVAEDERACRCGVLLVGQGNMICIKCGNEVPETSTSCPFCGEPFVELVSECPACGRRVDKNAFECECGVIFSDRVASAECSECNQPVEMDDLFCPKCGAKFGREPALEGKLERKVRR